MVVICDRREVGIGEQAAGVRAAENAAERSHVGALPAASAADGGRSEREDSQVGHTGRLLLTIRSICLIRFFARRAILCLFITPSPLPPRA